MKEYRIQRKEDGYWIRSRNVHILDIGVGVNDDLETGSNGSRIFLPLHNISQINEYEVEE